jgi:long-chain acyl-CoA synthetase
MNLLHEALRAGARRCPGKTALIAGEDRVSYAELWERVNRLAGFLASRFQAGARFGILLNNSIEAVAGLYAAPLAGMIAVPVDTDIHSKNLDRLLEGCGVGVLLTSGKYLTRLGPNRPVIIRTDGETMGTHSIALDSILGDGRNESIPLPPASESDVACLLHTGGTAGEPKGVMLTHRNLFAAVRNIVSVTGLDGDVIESVPMRLSHSFGFARIRSVLERGGTAILEDGFLRPERLLHRIKKWEANALSAVPAGFAVLLEHLAGPFSKIGPQIRFIETGSAMMSARHKEQLLGICPNAGVFMHYGLTESSRATFLDLRAERERWNTVGRPSPGIEIRIRDPRGNESGPNRTGEILVRGETTAAGYWHEHGLAPFADGWLSTGDLGLVDESGYLTLSGRISEMINLGGIKVSPREIEDALLTQEEILEAAVVGVPAQDAVAGIIIKAFLTVRGPNQSPDFNSLKKACLRELEAYKVPQEFEVVSSLPKTEAGKVRKDLLLGAKDSPHG